MGFWSRLFKRGQVNTRATVNSRDGWRTLLGGNLWAYGGDAIGRREALGFPAFGCAVRIISDTVASLPVKVWRDDMGMQTQVTGAEVEILNNRWNPDETAFDAKRKLIISALLYEAGYAWVERDADARKARGLWVLNPDAVTMHDGVYMHNDEMTTGIPDKIMPDEMIEVNFSQLPDGTGVSALNLAQGVLRMGIYAQKHASELFRRGAVPKVVLHGLADTPEGANEEFAAIEEAVVHLGESGRSMLYAPPGYKIEMLSSNNQHTQLVEMLRLAVEEIARVFNIPTQMLHSTEGSTYSNQEQAGMNLSKNTILPWTRQLEQQISSKFLQIKQRAEFDVSKLVRADFKTESEGYAKRIHSGQLTPNEARVAQGLPPVEDQDGADKLFMQGATTELGKEPAAPPPMMPGMPPEAEPDNGDNDNGSN